MIFICLTIQSSGKSRFFNVGIYGWVEDIYAKGHNLWKTSFWPRITAPIITGFYITFFKISILGYGLAILPNLFQGCP